MSVPRFAAEHSINCVMHVVLQTIKIDLYLCFQVTMMVGRRIKVNGRRVRLPFSHKKANDSLTIEKQGHGLQLHATMGKEEWLIQCTAVRQKSGDIYVLHNYSWIRWRFKSLSSNMIKYKERNVNLQKLSTACNCYWAFCWYPKFLRRLGDGKI